MLWIFFKRSRLEDSALIVLDKALDAWMMFYDQLWAHDCLI